MTNYKKIDRIAAHSGIIYKVELLNDIKLMSCSEDGLVKVWNTQNDFKCMRSFKAHSDKINLMHLFCDEMERT